MNIYGICLVKNEEDILCETLTKAAQWCDQIFVYDTGSSDATWEVATQLASQYPNQFLLYKKETRSFRDEIRGEVFNHYRHLAKDGDWWCRLDSDEIYIDNPKVFLAQLYQTDQVVFSLSCQYYFTEKELAEYEMNPKNFLATPVEDRLKHYICNHSEIRFFKHRQRLVWGQGSWPFHLGIVSQQRIRLKHLQYRSPEQIQKRLATRQQAIHEGYKIFASYDHQQNWQEKIRNSCDLHFDDGSGKLICGDQSLPNFLETTGHRIVKRVMQTTRLWP